MAPPTTEASGSRLSPEGLFFLQAKIRRINLVTFTAIAQKSQKWIQMQRKRYGEKRKGGFVDMGKQVR